MPTTATLRIWLAPLLLLSLFAAASCTTTRVPAAPAVAGITPADRALGVPINVALEWQPVPGASAYDVYFAQGNKAIYQCRVTTPRFVLETLSAGRKYAWKVNPVFGDRVVESTAASFTTAPAAGRDEMFAWSIRIANSVRSQYPRPQTLGGWNYTEGMLMDALFSIATRTHREDDFTYIQGWVDRFVREDGGIDPQQYPFDLYSLDRVRPGPVLLWMYGRTKEERYLKAATYVASQLDKQPRTSDGGYWHRSTYPNQMWLDGIYMADVYSVQYAATTNQPRYFDEAVKQIELIHKHTFDPRTGLYYHGWDETKSRPWANKETGASPEFWGRAIGWYAMALADVLDWLPADHPGRKPILAKYKALCATLLKYQDRQTAIWWQIIDKPTAEKNYVETSCSIMFAYAMTRGAQRGWLPQEYLEHARRATRGILNHKVDLLENNCMDIRGTVEVGSLGGNGGFYDYYVGVPQKLNDPKGVGAFMFLSMALSETANDTGPKSREFPRRSP